MKLKELLVEEPNELDEGWRGVVGGIAAAAAIGAVVVNTPPAYVDGERYEYATASAPEHAKVVKTDDGKKIKVWTAPRLKHSAGNNKPDKLYRPVE